MCQHIQCQAPYQPYDSPNMTSKMENLYGLLNYQLNQLVLRSRLHQLPTVRPQTAPLKIETNGVDQLIDALLATLHGQS